MLQDYASHCNYAHFYHFCKPFQIQRRFAYSSESLLTSKYTPGQEITSIQEFRNSELRVLDGSNMVIEIHRLGTRPCLDFHVVYSLLAGSLGMLLPNDEPSLCPERLNKAGRNGGAMLKLATSGCSTDHIYY